MLKILVVLKYVRQKYLSILIIWGCLAEACRSHLQPRATRGSQRQRAREKERQEETKIGVRGKRGRQAERPRQREKGREARRKRSREARSTAVDRE